MYIPLQHRHALGLGDTAEPNSERAHASVLVRLASTARARLGARQFSENGTKNANIKIGLIIGIIIGVFLIGCAAFLFFYGRSMRLKQKQRRHRHRRIRKTTSGSDGGAAPADPPADPPEDK